MFVALRPYVMLPTSIDTNFVHVSFVKKSAANFSKSVMVSPVLEWVTGFEKCPRNGVFSFFEVVVSHAEAVDYFVKIDVG